MLAVCGCLLIMVLCIAAYGPVLTAGLINRDDIHYLVEAGDLSAAGWWEALEAFDRFFFPSNTGGYYQPLTHLSYMLDAHLAAMTDSTRAFQVHLTNLVLHVLNVVLVFALLRRLSGGLVWPMLLATVFGLHPVQVGSVAWAAQRMTLLAAFFTLLVLYCYIRHATSRRILWLVPVTLCYAAAVLSRPTTLGLPIALLVLDLWLLRVRKGPVWRRRRGGEDTGETPVPQGAGEADPSPMRLLLEKAPLFLVMLACAARQFWLHEHVEVTSAVNVPGLQVIGANLASFAARILWPLRMSPFYPLSGGPGTAFGTLLAGVPVLLLLVALLAAAFRFSQPLFTALAGAVIMVFPGLLDAPFAAQLLGDAYLYPAMIIPAMAVAAWTRRRSNLLQAAWGRCSAVAVAAVCLIFAVRTNLQAYTWQSGQVLYKTVIRQYPDWAPGYLELVRSHIRAGDLDSALFYAEKAVAVAPDDPETQFYLGHVLVLHQAGRSAEALGPLRKALASNPNWVDCLHDLGVALAKNGQTDEAIVQLERARELRPNSPNIRVALGHAFLKADRPASARGEFQLALALRNDPVTHLGLARAWAVSNRLDLARQHLAIAVSRDPRLADQAGLTPELAPLRDDPNFEPLMASPSETPMPRPPGSGNPAG